MAKKSSSRRAPPSRPARPPAAKLWIGLRASLAALAIAAAATVWKQQFGSPPAAAPLGSTLSSRMAAPSPVELEVSHACEVARQLWGGEMSCSEFLAQHWEAWPKLSRPGTNWTRSLFSPSDVEWMIRQWPVRFHKNHGTAVLQKPGSGFLAHERTKRGDPVPEDILHVAMREGLTFVCHNLEVMHPSIASLVRHVAAFFHAYTQVNLYFSPPGLDIATAPHQDAHSVFIVQIYGSKHWTVHAPTHGNLTFKALQRGKRGEVLQPSDSRFMTDPVLSATLHPGDVLYVPRAFYHSSATVSPRSSGLVEAIDMDVKEGPGDATADISQRMDLFGSGPQPSLALTIAITTEDVFGTWLHLLGEALPHIAHRADAPRELRSRGAADKLSSTLRRMAAAQPGDDLSVMLREALPRALMVPENVAKPSVGKVPRILNPTFASGGEVDTNIWRAHALSLLSAAMVAAGMGSPGWAFLIDGTPDAAQREAIFEELDVVLRRKRIPCQLKLEQLDRFLREVEEARERAVAKDSSFEEELRGVDLDSIFAIEKRTKEYAPQGKIWYMVAEWVKHGG